jgi:hypothetical protein
LGLLALPAWAAPTLDGTKDASYSLRAVQTVQTQFGDNFSELDAAYAQVEGGVLYLMLTGNLEGNFNKLNIFIDSIAGGQNQIGPATDEGGTNPNNDDWAENYSGVGPSASGNGPGFTFDAAFAADYVLINRRGGTTFDFDFATIGGGAGGFEATSNIFGGNSVGSNASVGPSGFGVAFDNSNVGGVGGGTAALDAAGTAAALAVTTGLELAIPLSAIGNPNPQDILISAHVNGNNHDYLSNQSLGGFPGPQGNLGGDGVGNFNNDVSLLDLNNYPNTDQFFRAIPEPTSLVLFGLALAGLACGRKR